MVEHPKHTMSSCRVRLFASSFCCDAIYNPDPERSRRVSMAVASSFVMPSSCGAWAARIRSSRAKTREDKCLHPSPTLPPQIRHRCRFGFAPVRVRRLRIAALASSASFSFRPQHPAPGEFRWPPTFAIRLQLRTRTPNPSHNSPSAVASRSSRPLFFRFSAHLQHLLLLRLLSLVVLDAFDSAFFL